MAGRPATVRSGGVSGAQVGLIVFAFISVAALGLFIFQLTRVKELQQRAETAETKVKRLGQAPAPLGNYYENEASARGGNATVLGVMAEDLARVSQLVAGERGLVAKVLEEQSNELLKQISAAKPAVLNAGDTLLTAVRKLDERTTELGSINERQGRDLADAQQKADSLTQQLKAARDQFEEQIADTKADYEHAVTDFSTKVAAKDAQVRDLQGSLESREQELQQLKRSGDADKREWQLKLDQRDNQIAGFQKKIQELSGSFDSDAILKKADGRVLRAVPGSDIVYISLGANDNVKVGMSFEVFAQGAVGRALRGKGSLDVQAVMEDTSECLVTRSDSSQPIMEGDTIVNIAYEQGRKPKFVVRGDFDLNYDGAIDLNGAEEVKSMIRRWGGQVIADLDETVDYVVVGTAPKVPDVSASSSDIQRDQAERQLLKRTPFEALIQQAQGMHIPVITQNQFLFLTGYVNQPDRMR